MAAGCVGQQKRRHDRFAGQVRGLRGGPSDRSARCFAIAERTASQGGAVCRRSRQPTARPRRSSDRSGCKRLGSLRSKTLRTPPPAAVRYRNGGAPPVVGIGGEHIPRPRSGYRRCPIVLTACGRRVRSVNPASAMAKGAAAGMATGSPPGMMARSCAVPRTSDRRPCPGLLGRTAIAAPAERVEGQLCWG